MTLPDESQLAEPQAAFLRHLPQRVEVIGRRLQRFLQSGWDINGLARIHREAGSLGEASARLGLDTAGEHLIALRDLLAQPLADETLPDPTLGERVWNVLENLRGVVPRAPERREAPRQLAGGQTRSEVPPHGYWRRWGDDAPAPTFVEASPIRADSGLLPPPLVVREDLVIEQAPPDLPDDIDIWGDETPRLAAVRETVPSSPPAAAPATDAMFEREPASERAPRQGAGSRRPRCRCRRAGRAAPAR